MPPSAEALVAEAAETPPPLALFELDVLDVGGAQAETATSPAPARATAATESRRMRGPFLSDGALARATP
jgi:hypothetical protein